MSNFSEKMAARFDNFDRDGDGAVTATDFEIMARAVLTEVEESEGSAKGQAVLSGAQEFFDGLVANADVDGDGRISKTEFLRASEASLLDNPEGFSRIAESWVSAVVAVADRDGDGSVSYEEWSSVLVAMGARPEAAREIPPRLDSDGDGAITLAEVLEYSAAFYIDDEPRREFDAVAA